MMTELDQLDKLETDIEDAKDFLAKAYAKAAKQGIDIPHNAPLIKNRIQRLINAYNELNTSVNSQF